MNILRKTRRKLKKAFSRNRGGRNDRDSAVVPSTLSAPPEARAETATATSTSTATATPLKATTEPSTATPPKATTAPPKARAETLIATAPPPKAKAEASTSTAALNETEALAPAPTPAPTPAPAPAPAPEPSPPLIPAPKEAAEQQEQAPIEVRQLDQDDDQQALEQQLIPEENDQDWDDPMDNLNNPYFGLGPTFTFEEGQYPNMIYFDDQDSRGYFETLEDYDDTKIDMDDDDPNAVWEDTSLSRPLTDWYLPVDEWKDPWSGLMDQF